MTRALVRTIAGAVIAAAVVGAGELTYFLALCPQHQAWVRTEANPSRAVRDDGFQVARPGDALYVCTGLHSVGPLRHVDRSCDCAPRDLGADALGRLVGGACTLDNASPTRQDAFGACRYARCDTHID